MPDADDWLRTIHNIVWDVDGTLFDTYPAISRAFKAALNDLGADAQLARIADLARESLSHCVTTLAVEHQLDGHPGKPDPAAFNAIIERSGVKRDETMAVGDREIDVLAGKAAGVFTCFFGRDDAGVEADLVITNFGELARLLAPPDR